MAEVELKVPHTEFVTQQISPFPPTLSRFPLLFIFISLQLLILLCSPKAPKTQQSCAFNLHMLFYFKAVSERGFQTRSSSSVALQGT